MITYHLPYGTVLWNCRQIESANGYSVKNPYCVGITLYWSDDEDLPDGDWRDWTVTFYGTLPRAGKESEGGMLMRNDAILNSVEWRFPADMVNGWKANITINGEVLQEIDIASEPNGGVQFEKSCVLMRGIVVAAHIFHIEPHGDDMMPSQVNNSLGQGYNIVLNGVQQDEGKPFIEEGLGNGAEGLSYSKWQIDMA